ncbi:MAG: LysR family transcriptional regulator [Acetobacteraceae bacterium]
MIVPTLRQFTTFLAAVESGSVSAAARQNNLTQPAVSQQLRELERALGVRLLDRARGRMVPTAAGEAVLSPMRRVQAALDDVIATAANFRSGDAGRVRLGTGATACIYLLPPVLARLRRSMPGLDLTIATGNTPEILRRIEAGELDIGLVTLPVTASSSIAALRLLGDQLVALVPEALAPDTATIEPAQLARLPLVLYETGGTTRAIVDAWFRRAGSAPRPVMQLGSVEATKAVVAGGLGASVLPAIALPAPVAGTKVRRLSPPLARTLGQVLRREKVIDRGLRAVIDALEMLRTREAADTGC